MLVCCLFLGKVIKNKKYFYHRHFSFFAYNKRTKYSYIGAKIKIWLVFVFCKKKNNKKICVGFDG